MWYHDTPPTWVSKLSRGGIIVPQEGETPKCYWDKGSEMAKNVRFDGQYRVALGKYVEKGTLEAEVEVDAQGRIILTPIKRAIYIPGKARLPRGDRIDQMEDAGINIDDPDFDWSTLEMPGERGKQK